MHRPRVCAVKTIGDAQNRGQPPDDVPVLLWKRREVAVFLAGLFPAVVPGDQRQEFGVPFGPSVKIRVPDHHRAVLVVRPVLHEATDIVEHRRGFEQDSLRGVRTQAGHDVAL